MPAIFTDADKEELRRSMLEAGWECLLEHGYRATRVEDIARAVGIAPGTFYGFFPSKGAFVAQMVAENRHTLMDSLDVLIERAGGAPCREDLRRWMHSAWHGKRAIFRYIDVADYRKVRAALPDDVHMGPELVGRALVKISSELARAGLSPDAELASSLQRVCALTLLAREELAPTALERTVDALIEATLDALYGRPACEGEEAQHE